MLVRVDACDYAETIQGWIAARRQLRQCEQAAADAVGQWREELDELLRQFNDFRRAVQEALGYDQSELLHDDELVEKVRAAMLRAKISVTDPMEQMMDHAREQLAALPDFVAELTGSFVGSFEPMMMMRFEKGDGTTITVQLVQLNEDGTWHGTVVGVHGETDAVAGEAVTVRVSPSAPPMGITTAEALAGAEAMLEMLPRHVVPLGAPFRLEQAYAVEPTEQGDPEAPRCGENIAPGRVCDEAVPDGHCSEHGEVGPQTTNLRNPVTGEIPVAGPWATDNGPPTASMPPVQQPRTFTRGAPPPDDVQTLVVKNRAGDVWEFTGFHDDGQPAFYCRALDREPAWADLLHMHGEVYEVPAVELEAPASDQPPAKPNLHVATLYTSEQDGGSRWYELSDGWVVCARTLTDAMSHYPGAAVRLEPLRQAKPDLRNEGTATS